MTRPKLGIVIPVFNEEKRITSTLKALGNFYEKCTFECCLVDDGSSDGTYQIISQFVKTRPWACLLSTGENLGKGAAIRLGVSRLSSDFIFFTDADIPVPLHTIERALYYLERGSDMVIGSRMLAESQVIDRSLLRKYIGLFGNFVIRLVTKLPYRDTQCGFKGFRRACARDLFSCLTLNRYLFDVELLILAQKKQYVVKELPIKWNHVPDGSFKPVQDSVRAIWDLIRLAYRYN